MISMMEDLLTVEEVAKILRMSEENVKRMLRAKLLTGYKLSNVWRVSRADLMEYLNRQKNTGTK